jgi:predicted DNA-binding protein (UPF0251 family)
MQGFKPFGIAICDAEKIAMKYEEYEAIKSVNYDILLHDEASEKMEISRPTLTRIYNRALKKIAKAFVEGKTIIIEGGNFEFDKDWYKCKKCFRLIEGLENHSKCDGCNKFGNEELVKLNQLKDE